MSDDAAAPLLPAAEGATTDLLAWAFFVLGIGSIAPWTTLVGAIDYFKDVYPGRDAMRWVTFCYLLPCLTASLVNSVFPSKTLGHDRTSLGFLTFALVLFSFPVMDWMFVEEGHDGPGFAFALLLLGCIIIGLFDGISAGSFAGLSAYLPFKYYHAFLRGLGFSHLTMAITRFITKAALSTETNGLRTSARIFFFSASALCFACLAVQRFYIKPHPVVNASSHITEEGLLNNGSQGRHELRNVIADASMAQWLQTAEKITLGCITMTLTCFVSQTMYPGVASDVEWDLLGDWYSTTLVLLYSAGNFSVRMTPAAWIVKSPVTMTTLAVCRVLLIPVTFAVNQLFPSPVFFCPFFVFLAVSHGYLTTCSFAEGQKVEGRTESFIAGSILSFAFMAGLALGSTASLVWSQLA